MFLEHLWSAGKGRLGTFLTERGVESIAGVVLLTVASSGEKNLSLGTPLFARVGSWVSLKGFGSWREEKQGYIKSPLTLIDLRMVYAQRSLL